MRRLPTRAAGRGFPGSKLAVLEEWVQEGLQPDLTLFFDVSVTVGQARLKAASGAQDRFEREDVGFHERVRAVYLERVRRSPAADFAWLMRPQAWVRFGKH